MTRRFQFSVRRLLGVMLAVALCCSLFINVPPGALVSLGAFALFSWSWAFDLTRLSR
ncbi:MAG TPA: hypothetical protein VHC22_10715 [Pirellulales bacterium]|nr:hypothetical protein [Pirellulales bacterium]